MSAIMNGLMIAGDFFHVFAITVLLTVILKKRSSTGVSGKSQLLFTASYIIKYPNIWSDLYTLTSLLSILIMILMSVTVFLIYFGFKKTYQRKKDIFVTELLLIPSFLMTIWINYDFTPTGLARTYSTYVESVAILPQFYLIFEQRRLEKSIIPYLAAMGLYKIFYVVNWMYIYQTEGYFDPIDTGTGILYTTLFLLAFVEFLCVKIEITESRRQNFFKNIFLINTNEPLTDRLNLVSNDVLETDKSDSDGTGRPTETI